MFKKKWVKVLLGAFAALMFALVVAGIAMNESRPQGEPGARADQLAHELEDAIDAAAFGRTRALSWNFGDRHQHLWDRDRGLVQVEFGDRRVLLRLADQTGVAFEGTTALQGEAREEALKNAYAHFINDSFWLNPMIKSFDEGVTRSVVSVDGRDALLIEYAGGGLTPGDAYLWIFGDDGLPVAWKMWVSIIPIGGVRAGWENWVTLDTGAKIATRHPMGVFTLELKDVRGAATLSELVSDDPFAEL